MAEVRRITATWGGSALIGKEGTSFTPALKDNFALLRLAKKKANAEAKKRELEAAQKLEEERLLAKHKVVR